MSAIDRAVKLLEATAQTPAGLGVREAGALVGIPKTTAHRLLEDLWRNGLLAKDAESGRYQIGAGVLQLATAYLSRLDIRQRALPHMRRLRDMTNETVGLTVRIGDERMYVEQVESRHALIRRGEIGRPYPLYCGAPGRVLLAAMDDEEITAYLNRVSLERFTDNTPVIGSVIRSLVSEIRRVGFAAASAELIPDIATAAVSIANHTGASVAALSISGPTSRFEPLNAVPHLVETASSISAELGNHFKPDGTDTIEPSGVNQQGEEGK